MKLIIGLGNPGEKYVNTRHNLGVMVVGKLAGKLEFKSEKKFSAEICWLSSETILARPTVFMNQSGISVKRIAHYYKISSEDIWVLHDDVDLLFKKIKIVKNRGSAGHKGVMSVIRQLGTIDFVRFRLGIGHQRAEQRQKGDVEDYVLAPFEAHEQDKARKMIKKATAAIEFALDKGIKKAMNKFN